MRFQILALWVLLIAFSLKAQSTFENVISENTSEIPVSVFELDDGYLVCAQGNELSIGGWRGIKLIKTDFAGNVVWRKFTGKPNFVYAAGISGSMIQTNDGGYAIGGSFSNIPQTERIALLVKLDNKGDTIWTKNFGTSFKYTKISQTRQDSGNGFISFGYTDQFDPEGDYCLIKTDSIGNLEWKKTYGEVGLYEAGLTIELTNEGGFILGGQKGANNVDLANGYFIKTDSLGDIIWEKNYGTEGDDYIRYITQSKDGGYIIWGSADTIVLTSSEYDRSCIITKLDENGNVVWETYVSHPRSHFLRQLREMSDGSIVFIGEATYGEPYETAAWIGKLDADGNLLWERFHTYKERDFFQRWAFFNGDLQQTKDGGYIVAGVVWRQEDTTRSTAYNTMTWLVKLDSMGCLNGDCGITVGVDEISISRENELEIKVYPNPSQNILHIETKSEKYQVQNIQIIDLNGKTVLRSKESPIQTTELSSGIYFYQIELSGGELLRGKFVKN